MYCRALRKRERQQKDDSRLQFRNLIHDFFLWLPNFWVLLCRKKKKFFFLSLYALECDCVNQIWCIYPYHIGAQNRYEIGLSRKIGGQKNRDFPNRDILIWSETFLLLFRKSISHWRENEKNLAPRWWTWNINVLVDLTRFLLPPFSEEIQNGRRTRQVSKSLAHTHVHVI